MKKIEKWIIWQELNISANKHHCTHMNNLLTTRCSYDLTAEELALTPYTILNVSQWEYLLVKSNPNKFLCLQWGSHTGNSTCLFFANGNSTCLAKNFSHNVNFYTKIDRVFILQSTDICICRVLHGLNHLDFQLHNYYFTLVFAHGFKLFWPWLLSLW